MAAFTPIGVEAIVKGLGKFNSDLSSMDKSISNVGDGATRNSTKLGKLGTAIGGVATVAAGALVAGIGAAAAATVGLGVVSVKAAISYESAFTGVLKTTDGLTTSTGELNAEGEKLRQGFIDLSKEIPITPEVLASIGEMGGQLGVQRENLLGFTETMAQMGVTTNLTTEGAATGFARLGNIMQTPQAEFSNMGSAVVALGNNFATTESDVLVFSTRIAAAGALAGVSEAQVFGISAAFSSVGVQAEAGGTAVTKVLNNITKELVTGGENVELFANTAGLSAQEFARLWEEDAGTAFQLFVEGLSGQGENAILTLDALELTDSRLQKAFLSLAGAGDLLGQTMDVSTQAFADNTALVKEAELRFGTTESKLALLKNQFGAIKIAIGTALLPAVNTLIDEFGKLTDGTSPLLPLFEQLGEFLSDNIPTAIQTASDFWRDKLVPAMKASSDFITGTAIPAIQEVIKWLQENIPIAIQTASDFWESILKPAIKVASDFITDVAIPAIEDVIKFLQDNLPTAVETSGSVWENTLKPAIKTVSDFITSVVIPAFTTLQSWFETNMPVIRAATETAWIVIQSIIKSVADVITSSVMPQLQQAFGNLTTIVETLGIDWGVVWTAIKTAIQIVATIIGAIIVGIIAVVVGLVTGITAAATTIIGGLVKMQEGFIQFKDGAILALNGILTFIRGVFTGDFALMQQGIENFVKGNIEAFSGLWTAIVGIFEVGILSVKELVVGFITGVVDFFTGLVSELVGNSIIPDMWNAIVQVFQSGIETVLSLVATLVSDMVSAFSNAISQMVSVGKDIIAGLVEGIKSSASSVATALRSIIDNAIQAAKDALLSGSPSRVFIEIGEDIVEGLIQGIESGMGGVRNVIAKLIDVGGKFGGFGFASQLGEIVKALETRSKDITKTLTDINKEMADINEDAQKERLKQLESLEKDQAKITENINKFQISATKAHNKALEKLQSDRIKKQGQIEDLLKREELTESQRINLERLQIEEQALSKQQKALQERGIFSAEQVKELELLQSELASIGVTLKNLRESDILTSDDIKQLNVLTSRRLFLLDKQAGLMKDLAKFGNPLARFEEATKVQKFLTDQIGLLNLLRSQGIDTASILEGLEFGIDAPIEDFVKAQAKIAEVINKRLQIELQANLKFGDVIKKATDELSPLQKVFNQTQELAESLGVKLPLNRIREFSRIMETFSGIREKLLTRELSSSQSTFLTDILETNLPGQAAILSDNLASIRNNLSVLQNIQEEESILKFLQDQRKLIADITKEGFDANAILGDFQFGVDTTQFDFLNAVLRFTQAQIGQQEELLVIQREQAALAEEQAALAEEQAVLAVEQAILAAKQAALQAEQARLKFLQDQQKLLQDIADKGFDLTAILQGFQIGIDANQGDFFAVLTRFTQAMIAQIEDELGIASPSKVFANIGKQMLQGLAGGMLSTLRLPERVMQQAINLMTPQIANVPSVVSSNNVNITNNVRDNLDLAIIDTQINRALSGAL